MSNRAWGHGRVRTAVAALVVALSVVTLTACTAEPPPDDVDAPPQASLSPTSTATPTATSAPDLPGTISALPDGVKPERPPIIDGPPTVEAATALATYFVQLYPYAIQTNDVADLAAISHPDCVFCGSARSSVDTQIEREERTVGGGISISSVTATEVVPGQHFAVQMTIDEAPSHLTNKFDMVVEEHPEPERFSVDMAIVQENGQWLVRAVTSTTVTM